MRILISGANGFIGSHLINYFKDLGEQVWALHRKEAIPNLSVKYQMNYDTFYNSNLEFDILIHCAGAAHRVFTETELNESNVRLTEKLVNKAKSLNVKMFVFLSTCNVYNNKSGIISIDTALDDSNNPPIKTKLKAEHCVINGLKSTTTKYCILRLPLVYGKGVKGNFGKVVNACQRGIPLPFRLVKANSRSYLYIGNLSSLIQTILKCKHMESGILLVSDDSDVSTSLLLKNIFKELGTQDISIPVPVVLMKSFASVLLKTELIDKIIGNQSLDISKTKQFLNWVPPYSFKQGLKDTIN